MSVRRHPSRRRMGLVGVIADALHQRHRPQDGFALAATLTAMLVASLLVAALLGLTFATTALSGEQFRRDSETRAADAAIQSAIARIARDDTAVLGTLEDTELCNWSGEDEADRPAIPVEVNGKAVEVTCEAERPQVYAPDRQVGDQVHVVGEYEGAEALSGVGGTPVDAINALNWKQTPADGVQCLLTSDDCFPWREAAARGDQLAGIGTPTINTLLPQLQLADRRVGIAHTGSDPVRFIGDVQVKEGVAAVRNDRDCKDGVGCRFKDSAPGLSASGTYAQGDPGWLSSGGDPCGILVSKQVTSTPRPFQMPSGQVLASEGAVCDAAGPKGLSASSKISGTGWTPNRVASSLAPEPRDAANRVLPWNPVSCPWTDLNGRLVRFSPGAYTKNMTAVINRWINVCTANLGDFVFHFQPGDYWFDADSGNNDHRRNALLFDHEKATVVFGVPLGWGSFTTAQNRPAADSLCDPTKNGATITLSPRTSIIHRKGIVNICGVQPTTAMAQPTATIYQEPEPDLGVTASAMRVAGGATVAAGWSGFIDLLYLIANGFITAVNWTEWFDPISPVSPNYQFPLQSNTPPNHTVPFWIDATCVVGPCDFAFQYGVQFAPPEGTSVPDAEVNSAMLTVTGNASGMNREWNSSKTRVEVMLPSRPGVIACRMEFPRAPEVIDESGSYRSTYDLMDPGVPGNCSGAIKRRADLLNAGIFVTHEFDRFGPAFPSISVDAIEIRTAWYPRPSGLIDCQVSGRDVNTCQGVQRTSIDGPTPLSATALNGQGEPVRIRHNSKCFTILWGLKEVCDPVNSSATTTIGMRNLDDRYNPDLAYSDTARISTAGLLVAGDSTCKYMEIFWNGGSDCDHDNDIANGPNTRLRVRLMSGGGQVCAAEYRRIPEFNETRYLDLFASAGGNVLSNSCRGWLMQNGGRKNADLVGKDLFVDLIMEKRSLLDIFNWPPWKYEFEYCTRLLDCKWWGYDLDRISLVTTSGESDPENAFPGPRSPMRVTSNFAFNQTQNGQPNPNYPHRARFSMYGPLSLPASDLNIRWSGPASPKPIVSGFAANGSNPVRTMAVRGIGSDTRPAVNDFVPTTGIACCAEARPGERVVILRAWIGRLPGQPFDPDQLRSVAKVRIIDQVPALKDGEVAPGPQHPQPGTYQAANRVRVEEWRVCTKGGPDERCSVT